MSLKLTIHLNYFAPQTKCHPQAGRDRLIEGSRGILQGTTAMLISFDASQVKHGD